MSPEIQPNNEAIASRGILRFAFVAIYSAVLAGTTTGMTTEIAPDSQTAVTEDEKFEIPEYALNGSIDCGKGGTIGGIDVCYQKIAGPEACENLDEIEPMPINLENHVNNLWDMRDQLADSDSLDDLMDVAGLVGQYYTMDFNINYGEPDRTDSEIVGATPIDSNSPDFENNLKAMLDETLLNLMHLPPEMFAVAGVKSVTISEAYSIATDQGVTPVGGVYSDGEINMTRTSTWNSTLAHELAHALHETLCGVGFQFEELYEESPTNSYTNFSVYTFADDPQSEEIEYLAQPGRDREYAETYSRVNPAEYFATLFEDQVHNGQSRAGDPSAGSPYQRNSMYVARTLEILMPGYDDLTTKRK